MAYDGSLKFDTQIDTNGFTKGANTIKSQANGLKSTLAGLGKAMFAAFSITALVAFGTKAVDVASDLTEVQNVVDTAFRDMSYKIEEFADNAIDNFGLSELAAKQMSSTYMAMSTGMGQAADQASDMAIEITGRLGDVMSFYNKTQSEADTIGRALYSGETEPLKALGVVMTQTNLKAFAMAKGFSKAYDEMSSGEQLLVRQQFFLEQTSLAAGDFVKTSGSWANQTRVLSERWREFMGIIGNGLIQVLTPTVKFLNTAMSYMIEFSNAVGNVLSSVFGLSSSTAATAKNTAAIATNSSEASAGLSDMGDSAKEAAKKANGTAGFDKLNNTTEEIAKNSSYAASALSGIGNNSSSSSSIAAIPTDFGTEKTLSDAGKLEIKITQMAANVKALLQSLNTWLTTNFSPIFAGIWIGLQPSIETFKMTTVGIFTNIQSLGQLLLDYFAGPFTTMLQQYLLTAGVIVTGLFDTFNTVFSDIWNLAIFPILQTFITLGLPMITSFATQMYSLVGTIFTNVKRIFDMLWADAARPVISLITKAWTDFIKLLSDFWNKWGVPIFNNIKAAWQSTSDLFVTLWKKFLKPIWDKWMEVMDKLWTDHLKPLLANFLDFVGELVNGALEIYNKFIAPLVKWFVEKLGPPIAKIITGLIDKFGEFFGNIIDAISGIITALKGIVQFITGVFTGDWKKAWEGVQNIFKGIFDALVNIVKTPVNLIIDIINGMVSGIASGINTVIDAANALSFKAPEWAGGKTYGVQIKKITAPKIPRLATGTVVPKNYGEFLSILGDNKREAEVVSPLSTMKQAFKEAMVEMGGNGSGDINLNVYLSGKQIHTEVVKQDKDYRSQTGNSAFAY